MKRLISLLSMVVAMGSIAAQDLERTVVATAGETFAANNLILDWTLGEIMTETYTGTVVLTQGFHQPTLNTTSVEPSAAAFGDIQVYPNPTTGQLFIERESSELLQVRLFNAQGQTVLRAQMQTSFSTLDLSALPASLYVLQLSDGERKTPGIRIVVGER